MDVPSLALFLYNFSRVSIMTIPNNTNESLREAELREKGISDYRARIGLAFERSYIKSFMETYIKSILMSQSGRVSNRWTSRSRCIRK